MAGYCLVHGYVSPCATQFMSLRYPPRGGVHDPPPGNYIFLLFCFSLPRTVYYLNLPSITNFDVLLLWGGTLCHG